MDQDKIDKLLKDVMDSMEGECDEDESVTMSIHSIGSLQADVVHWQRRVDELKLSVIGIVEQVLYAEAILKRSNNKLIDALKHTPEGGIEVSIMREHKETDDGGVH